MKLIYIANARIPTEKTHGLQIIKMSSSFVSAGVDVELVVPTRINSDFDGVDVFSYYKVESNFVIKKIKTFDPRRLLKFPVGTYIKFQSFFFMVSLFFYLLRRNNQDDVFYTRDEYLLPLLLLFSKKVVWEGHNLPQNKKYYFNFWSKCLKIVVITNGLKKELIKLGLVNDKILVAPDGVDLESFYKINKSRDDIRKELGLPVDKNIIIYAGHLYSWKGAQILADASKFLDQDCLVVFIGGTDYDIANFKVKNQHYGNIIIIGRKPHNMIPLYLKSADALVLPNSAEKEISRMFTSPMKLFEYMASQRPIIASDLPSIREILSDATAFLVKPDDVKDLANRIQEALTNHKLSDIISEEAFNKVKNYTWHKRAENIINFIMR